MMNLKKRFIYLLASIIVMIIGFCMRKYPHAQPAFVAEYFPDAVWAMMIYIGVGVLFPNWRIAKKAIASLIFCYAIECSQLYKAPWIKTVRANRLGGLILGFDFVWSDIICYTCGIAFIFGVEYLILKWIKARNQLPINL